MTFLRPLHDQILVRQDFLSEQTSGGILIPDSAARALRDLQQDLATVIAVGPGKYGPNGERVAPDLLVGDRVLFRRRPGTALFDGLEPGREEYRDLLMLTEDDVLGVVTEE